MGRPEGVAAADAAARQQQTLRVPAVEQPERSVAIGAAHPLTLFRARPVGLNTSVTEGAPDLVCKPRGGDVALAPRHGGRVEVDACALRLPTDRADEPPILITPCFGTNKSSTDNPHAPLTARRTASTNSSVPGFVTYAHAPASSAASRSES